MKLIILTVLSILGNECLFLNGIFIIFTNLIFFFFLISALTYAQVDCNLPECLYNPKIGESLPVTEEEIQDECK